MSTFCASCGTALRSGAAYCPQCGVSTHAADPGAHSSPERHRSYSESLKPVAIAAGLLIVVSSIALYLIRPDIFDRREGFEDIRLGMSRAELKAKGFRCPEGDFVCSMPIDASQLAAADPVRGEAAFARCQACHTSYRDGANGIGPNLWNVFGSAIGTNQPDFLYSQDLKAMAGHWDVKHLDAFLDNPKLVAPGTKMSFAGLADSRERADLIAYLNTLQPSTVPLVFSAVDLENGDDEIQPTRRYTLFDRPASVVATFYEGTTVGDIRVSSGIAPRELHRLLSARYGPSQIFVEWRDELPDGSRPTKLTWWYWQVASGMTILANSDGSAKDLSEPPDNWQWGYSSTPGHAWVQYLGPYATGLVIERASRGEVRLARSQALVPTTNSEVDRALGEKGSPSTDALAAAQAAAGSAAGAARDGYKSGEAQSHADAVAAASAAERAADEAKADAEEAAGIAELEASKQYD